MNTTPKITVLMPVFNAESFLQTAIDSILAQSYSNFEFLIIDDGSTDNSRNISEASTDPRIRRENNGRNLGLIATLNKGLELAKGDYIARMDADDASLPKRLEKQLAFMENNPEVGLCGTWIEKISEGKTETIRFPKKHKLIRFFMLFDNPFAHNTIMFRRSFLEQHAIRYDSGYKFSEDYELWDRCASLTTLANVPEALARYNYHADNTSNRHRNDQAAMAGKIRMRQIKRLDSSISETEIALHNKIVNFEPCNDLKSLADFSRWLDRIVGMACRQWRLEPSEVWPLISRFWYGACGQHADLGWSAFQMFRSSPAGRAADLEWQFKLLYRCLLRRGIQVSQADINI